MGSELIHAPLPLARLRPDVRSATERTPPESGIGLSCCDGALYIRVPALQLPEEEKRRAGFGDMAFHNPAAAGPPLRNYRIHRRRPDPA
ncbi:hypothetical protein SDC9_204961 [bioreactor metagenome]|uniref:Uncharacterized protein n=1 Tax=bioreactor metagenome TaxID=1076179 RepID=A0A645J1I9_9ZZZZ